ncbi:hypothetical protein P6144_00140 [Sphingomonas sp. HITSZ_GF]|uniref:hypothetical protein n=1 Tax=Sphingomonas sp. HITSZ_GF TaxID=3037247 RepID=UPI00240E6C1B|nr:hypothetical protein [Sphingomonas sp. HITSZ_GF]MDG2532044.1 hypothetical protein [Sphingomonas sp. HITSZ_GF]
MDAKRPGYVASREARAKAAQDRYQVLWRDIEAFILDARSRKMWWQGAGRFPPVPVLMEHLEKLGHRAPRGGPITYNVVQRTLDRCGDRLPPK